MPGRDIVRCASPEVLAQSVAGRLATLIIDRQADGGSARILLAGGAIVGRALDAFASLPALTGIDGRRVNVWWSDERFVPMGSQDRNDQRAWEIMRRVLGVPEHNLHRISGPQQAIGLEAAARDYAVRLRAAALPEDHSEVPAFDVAVLSIGEDGHVASLFPEHPALHGTASVVAVHAAPKPPSERVSLGLSSLCAAKEVWLLASGLQKATAVRLMLDSTAGALQVPAAGVFGRVRTLLLADEDAASRLPSDVGRPGG